MQRQHKRRIERDLKSIKILSSNEKLTATTGIGIALELLHKSPLMSEIERFLPLRTSHRSLGSSKLALTLIAAHMMGAESIKDIEALQEDPFLVALFDGAIPAPRTLVDFLNDFESFHIEGLNQFLNTMGKTLHSFLISEHGDQISSDRILDIDSTYHVHYGELIEGLWWNYKKEWSLESQSAFSSLGFCHHVWLRPGNTKSGTDCDAMIHNLYRDCKEQVWRKRQGLDFLRMDSAFCNQDTIKASLSNGTFFTITAHKATTGWHHLLDSQGVDWVDWMASEEETKKFKKAGIVPQKVQLTRIWWSPSWAESKLVLPIIIKRTWKSFCKIKDKQKSAQASFLHAESAEESGGWDYYAVVTNLDLTKWSYQEVMSHHQKRASSENMNKEVKYGYKLNNFPCRRMVANQAWYVFAMIAHNFLRFISLMDNPENPHMAKKIRREFINFPAKILERSKQIFLKVPQHFYQEVIEKIAGWRFPERVFAHMLSTA